MKLSEAIKIKLQWRKDNYPPALADEMNADLLSIKALEAVKSFRTGQPTPTLWQLPGETKE